MSTLLVAAIIVVSIVSICLLLIGVHNKHKREAMNNLLNHFSQLGTQNNLSFSSQELLHDCILGLDGMNRKILVVTKKDDSYGSFIVDLDEIQKCTVKKIYGTIAAGGLKTGKIEEYLEKISLHFELRRKPSIEIVFYKNLDSHIYEAQELERKAKHWEAILSKMQKSVPAIA